MKVTKISLAGVLLFEPQIFRDERGFFLESFQADRYREYGVEDHFVQDNHSRSLKGILRGLHFQVRRPQAQLVTVIQGRIFDAVVDLRPGSESFGRWFGTELSDTGLRQIYMPPGFAHGFCVLSPTADVHYKVTQKYDHADEGGLLWSDPDVGIQWPSGDYQLSPRDAQYPRLSEIPPERLPQWSSK
jgi:dTDP-4-dehydrorhamnose 3,5-epimerase